tara:strand:+ start:749 stop:1255 length:507 start_codon:yes stop_codon:yes gene_type:complete
MKKSEIYNIIKEELEVILTNEEVEEIFDLDLAALLDEMVTISTDDLYLAEMFDTGSDTKESCAAKGLSWDESAGKCGPWKSGLEEKKLSSKERKDMSSSSFIFPKERKFPIPDESHGRNALSRANQYSSVPSWYDGSLESLVKRVHSAVKKKFPGIETTPASAKPGKG